MIPEKELELVHLQITRNCNLRCWFCGQWGQKGFFSNASGEEMTLEDWKRVIDSLIQYRNETGDSPSVILWGGEPLVSSVFKEITQYISENKFELGLITNGVMIDRYLDVLRRDFKKIYVSIDGDREIHDSIRGKGVFDKVFENVKLLQGGTADIIISTVLSPAVLEILEILPEIFSSMQPSEILLQDMIYMTKEEIDAYAIWFRDVFGSDAKEIYAWESELSVEYMKKKANVLEKIRQKQYPIPIKILEHGRKTNRDICLSSSKHIHVAWNGNVLYCTDFYDFSAGNVKNEDMINIFNNELSDKFRKEVLAGKCGSCKHCSWINSTKFKL